MNSQSISMSPELVRLAEDLMVAIAFEELIRPTVVAYENEILARLQLPVDPKFRESAPMTTLLIVTTHTCFRSMISRCFSLNAKLLVSRMG